MENSMVRELACSNIPLFTTETRRTQSEEMILSAAEAADRILHADSRHGE